MNFFLKISSLIFFFINMEVFGRFPTHPYFFVTQSQSLSRPRTAIEKNDLNLTQSDTQQRSIFTDSCVQIETPLPFRTETFQNVKISTPPHFVTGFHENHELVGKTRCLRPMGEGLGLGRRSM